MKVVVLSGPESAGKSSLCRALAQHFNAPIVREYVREYMEQHQRETCYADVEIIAREQWRREQAARALNPPLLLLDTNLLSNRQWSRVLFGRSPSWIDWTLQQQPYDLVCLLSPDGLPWQADGLRCQPDLAERQAFHDDMHDWLQYHHQPVRLVGGGWPERYRQLRRVIEGLLPASWS